MRSESWVRTRQERAERTFEERGPSLSALLHAFREVTDDPVSEEAARIVGQALGVLPVEALLELLQEAKEALIRAAGDAAGSTSAAIAAGSALLRAEGLHLASVRVSDVRARVGGASCGMLIELAAALQALNWAVSRPDERSPLIVY